MTDDAVAFAHAAHIRSDLADDASEFNAGQDRGPTSRFTHTDQFAPVQTGGHYLHDCLAGAGCRARNLLDFR
jgi:hypothetical protein